MTTPHRLVLALVLVPAGLLALLLAAWTWRDGVARTVANRLLAGQSVTVVDLQALGFEPGRVAVGRLDVHLGDPAQRLVLADLGLHYRGAFPAWRSGGRLTLGSVRLEAAASPPDARPAPDGVALARTVAAALALARDFPLAEVAIAELWLPGSQPPLAVHLQATPGAVDVRVHGGTLAASGSFRQAADGAPATVALRLRDGTTDVGMAVTVAAGADPSRLDFSASADLLDWAPVPGSRIGVLQADAAGRIELDADAVRLELAPGFRLAVGAAQFAGGELAGLTLTGTSALQVEGGLALDGLQVQAGALSGSLARLSAGEWRLTTDFDVRDLQHAGVDAGGTSLRLVTRGLDIAGPLPWLPAFELDAAFALDRGRLTFNAPLRARAAGGTTLQVQGSHDLGQGTGQARVDLAAVDFAGPGRSLAVRLGGWPWDADLLAGTLVAGADLHWQSTPTAHITGHAGARLAGIGGHRGQVLFHGVAAALEVDIDSAGALPVSIPPLRVSVAALDVGLPIEDVTVDLRVQPRSRSVVLDALQGGMLGGTISASDQRFRIDDAVHAATVRFTGFRLERVLELAAYEAVQASGAVSGVVPLVIGPEGLEVTDGRLSADAPGGSIRYLRAPGHRPDNAAVDTMSRALSNFQFATLESSIDYSPDGELVLAMQVKGHNPDMDDGRPVILNLNLRNNVIALLRSLRAGREIEAGLEARYR